MFISGFGRAASGLLEVLGPLAARRFSAWFCLWFAKLRQLSDVKDQGIRQPVRRRQPQFPLAGLGVRSDRELQNDLVGQHGIRPLVLKIRQFVPDFDDFLDGRGIFRLFSQFIQPLSQVVDLFRRKRLDALDDFGLNAPAGNIHVRRAFEKLPADGDAERVALSAAGGIGVAGMWRVLLRLHRRRGRQQNGQHKTYHPET